MAELSQNEKKLLAALEPLKTAGPDTLSQVLGNREEAVVQHAYLLADRGLAEVLRIDRGFLPADRRGRRIRGEGTSGAAALS